MTDCARYTRTRPWYTHARYDARSARSPSSGSTHRSASTPRGRPALVRSTNATVETCGWTPRSHGRILRDASAFEGVSQTDRIRDASARASARRGSVRTTRRCSQMANAGSCRDPLDDCRGSAAGPCPAELTLRRQGAPGARTPPARVTVTVAQGPPRLRRWRASRTPTLRCRRRLPVPGPSSNPGHPISAANQPWRVPAGEGWLRGGCTPGFAARTSPSDSRRASEPQPWNGCLSIRGRPEARRSPGLGCHPVHALPLPPRDPGHGMRQRPHTPMCGRLVSDLSAMSGRASGEAPGNAALGAGHL